MRVAGRNVKDYLVDSWAFFVVIVIVMAIVTGLRLGGIESSSVEGILGIVGVLFLGGAGWIAATKGAYSLVQIAFLGFLLSFGTHWALPIFHRGLELWTTFLTNSVLYAVVAVVGGWLGRLRSHSRLERI